MSKIGDMDADTQRLLSDQMEMKLGGVVSSFADEHGLSGLSAATLAFHMLCAGLQKMGGPAAKAYLGCLVSVASASDEREARKINDRARRAMEKMAAHYDAIAGEFAKRTMQ